MMVRNVKSEGSVETPELDVQRQHARALRKKGMSVRAIAREMGVAPSSVQRWTSEHTAKRERERAAAANQARAAAGQKVRRTMASCPICGGPMKTTAARCAKCRANELAARDEQIVELWNQGATIPVIAEAVSLSEGGVKRVMRDLRARGSVTARRADLADMPKPSVV